MKRENRLRKLGKEVSSNSNCRVQMSALIIRKGVVIAQGFNKKGYRGGSIHAEIDALRQLERQKNGPEGADMWLFRFGGFDGDANRMSKPCSHCIESIYAAGIKRVFYYDWDGNLQVLKMRKKEKDEYYTPVKTHTSPCR